MKRCMCRAVLSGFVLGWAVAGAAQAGESAADGPAFTAGVLCAHAAGSTETRILPLKLTEVKLRLIAGVVTATVSQHFENDTPYPLEAVYLFPLPSQAAVTDMQLALGDRIIRSVVREKEEAQATYEEAKKAGKAAALVESERPNVFRTSVANFMPGETAVITFSYTEPAELRAGVYSVTFPLVVGQRYFPAAGDSAATERAATAAEDGAQDISPPVLPPTVDPAHRVTIELDILGVPADRIESTTHRIAVQPIEGMAEARRVTLADDVAVPDAEFSVDVHIRAEAKPAITWVASESGGALHGLLTVFPSVPPEEQEAKPRDVVFVIDTSGSMGGTSIEQARAGLKGCLALLRPADRFNIVRFASDFTSYAPDLVPAGGTHLDAALRWTDGLQANGGTEMQPALASALDALAHAANLPIAVFLTDGCVGNEAALLELLGAKLGSARIFAFGIGSAPNEYLMRRVAMVGRGQCRFIRSEEDIGGVVADLFRTLSSPVLTDVSVAWESASGEAIAGIEQYPQPCPDVFSERPVQVVARFAGERPARATISGTCGGQAQRFTCDLDPQPLPHLMVPRLFGRARIDDLMAAMIGDVPQDRQAALKDAVIASALEYQLVTPYTSRVAVEEQVVRNPAGELQTVRVPTPPPRGWTMFNPTATRDPLAACAAAALLLLGFLLRRAAARQAA